SNQVLSKSQAGGVSADWCEEFGEVSDCIVRYGRVADAVTIARPDLEIHSVRRTPAGRNLQAVLLGVGRPVVVVPPTWQAKRIEHAAIGWNESLEASRALAMTIPWLVQMQTVTVIVSNKRKAAVQALLDYLAAHGIEAQVRLLDTGRGPVGQAILDSCAAAGAELLVVGGFSHSRSRQLLFGGVTQHLLNHSEIVTVMVH
ncbi:MAG: universal stress protein, partial [Gammaproteobacteria bacterium]|nr:universal stress protein [Gammaproteobacteria bacterium]